MSEVDQDNEAKNKEDTSDKSDNTTSKIIKTKPFHN